MVLIWNAYGKSLSPEEEIARGTNPLSFMGVNGWERASMMTVFDLFWDTVDIVRFFASPSTTSSLNCHDLFTTPSQLVEEYIHSRSSSWLDNTTGEGLVTVADGSVMHDVEQVRVEQVPGAIEVVQDEAERRFDDIDELL